MIMNNNLFAKFFYVNDADRIGRDSNSCAIYFHTSSKSSDYERNEGIKVGNWKKESTRFGDLSAQLLPVLHEKEHQIQCKILRSFNQDAVEYFQYILTRVLVLYNEQITEQIELFQTFLPSYRPYAMNKPAGVEKDMLLTKVEPLIFKPNDYTRGCQNKPPVVVEDISNLAPEKVLQFPKIPVEFKGEELKPRYYYCADGIPGYIQMNVEDHPFDGKAPCCYALSNSSEKKVLARLKRNELVEKALFPSLFEGTEDETPIEERDKLVRIKRFVMYTPTNEYKVLNRLGQFGNLPSTILHFLHNINLEDTFYRVGICSEWKFSSILACGVYAAILDEIEKDAQKIERYKNMPAETEVRRKFSSICFNIVSQENCKEMEPVKDYVLNFQKKLDVRRLYNAIQYFFKINLLVINTKGDWVKPNSAFSFCPHFFKQRPVLLLYEHTKDMRYEIIAKCTKDSIVPYFQVDDVWKFIYLEVLSTFTKDAISCTPHERNNAWLYTSDGVEIQSQILTKNGQVQILVLRYSSSLLIPVYLEHVIAPFAVSSTEKYDTLPEHHQVVQFLRNIKVEHFETLKEKGVICVTEHFYIPYQAGQSTPNPHHVYFFLRDGEMTSKWNEQVGNFIYTNLLKDYLLILFGQFLKSNEIKEPISTIEFFIETHIKWLDSYDIDWRSFQPLIERNEKIYNGEFIFVPRELEFSIKYLLEWYYRNRHETLLDMAGERELPTLLSL